MTDDAAPTTQFPTKPAIFADQDIPCPHCGYNLRGLVEPRCPECGSQFDPIEILRELQARWRKPPLLRTIWTVLRHPVRVWSMPEAGAAYRLSISQVILLGMLVPVVMAVPSSIYYLIMDFGRTENLAPAFCMPGVVGVFVAVGALVSTEIHACICIPMLALSECDHRPEKARRIVRLSLAWLLPAALFGVVAFWLGFVASFGRGYSTPFPGLGFNWYGFLAVLGFAMTALGWTTSIYAGVLSFARCRRHRSAALCAATNPMLWIIVLVTIGTIRDMTGP